MATSTLMINCWFGWKAPFESQTTNPNQQWTISWQKDANKKQSNVQKGPAAHEGSSHDGDQTDLPQQAMLRLIQIVGKYKLRFCQGGVLAK